MKMNRLIQSKNGINYDHKYLQFLFHQIIKNELYDKYGHIMYLICIKGKCDKYNRCQFDLQNFIKTITNRQGQNVMQRAKLLKVEVIECNDNQMQYPPIITPQNRLNINNSSTLKLKITVSSPHIFQRFFQHQRSLMIDINNLTFKYEIPEMYHIQSQMHSLNLCIRPFSASQDYVLCITCYMFSVIRQKTENSDLL